MAGGPRPCGRRRVTALAGAALVAAAVSPALAAPAARTAGRTTLQGTVVGDVAADYATLRTGPGWPRVVRRDLAKELPGRAQRRTSLLYFAALDELHYTDEESPARVEFLDRAGTPFTSAWKPQEALVAFEDDQTIRAVNALAAASPVPAAGGRRARMGLAVVTGDMADNQQFNEDRGVLRLLEGGRLDPNSGVAQSLPCPAGPLPAGEAERYTGVQDYRDYTETDAFYDPNQPAGRYARWPRYPGLMDRAQQPFTAAGLAVPSYVTLGNHDRLQQGNQAPNAAFEAVAVGCAKVYADPLANPGGGPGASAPTTAPTRVAAVPADPSRRSLSYPEYRALFAAGRQRDAHGFRYVDPGQLRASNGAASYYAFSPRPGLRFVSINTVSEGGVAGPSAEGNIDNPQFQWLAGELARARRLRQRVVVFGHHPIANLTSTVPDEAAPPCTTGGHDPNAGCDLDPRSSQPVRGGAALTTLLLANPNVVAYVAGHTAKIRVTPFRRPGGGGFWQVESGSASSWPNNARVLELMDNHDGTLSLFGTVVDQAGPVGVPSSGTPASRFTPATLAAIGRTFAFNDYQENIPPKSGTPADRNVELLLPDPVAHSEPGSEPASAAGGPAAGRPPAFAAGSGGSPARLPRTGGAPALPVLATALTVLALLARRLAAPRTGREARPRLR